MSDITLYGFPPSSYTWTARMVAEEKGISHDLEPIEFGSDALKALHPFGKIPIMTHGDLTLYETAAICRYIDEAFDGPAPFRSNSRRIPSRINPSSNFLI